MVRGVIAKALVYITHDEQLLVFRQPDHPEQGIQVPGGSVEPGEQPARAALREAFEETGLRELSLRRYLGSTEYRLKVDAGPPHLRHFFHLGFGGRSAPRWLHVGSRRPSGAVVRFELWWQPLSAVRLDWEMDAFLAALRH
jgi:8-oxo-dGTP diphosphatase